MRVVLASPPISRRWRKTGAQNLGDLPKVPQQNRNSISSRPGRAGTRWAPSEGRGGPPRLGRPSSLGKDPALEGPHGPAPTFLDSRQLGLVDGDFSHVGLGSGLHFASGFPAAACTQHGPARSSSSARRGAKSRRQRSGPENGAGRRARAGDKGGGRRTRAQQAAPPQPPARAPGPDQYQIPGARKWTRAGQYGGREETERRAGGRAAGPGWGGGGELQVCNRNSSGWRAQICSCGRLPAVSFVPSDAPEAKAPAPAPCLPPKGGSRLSAGALCPEGLGQKVARIPHKSRYCRQCSSHSWVLSTGCFLCAWLSGALFVSWD